MQLPKETGKLDTNKRKCAKCGAENPLNADFCAECGEKLSVNNANVLSRGFSNWSNKSRNYKIITGFLGCCVGAFIILLIIGAIFPMTNLALDNTNVQIDNQTTDYMLKGNSEANATVIISSKALNLNNVEINPTADGKFEYKLQIPKNVNTSEVVVTAKSPKKSENQATATIKRPTAQTTTTTTTKAPAELNSDSVKSIIGDSNIRSVDVKDGAVTVKYSLNFINDDNDGVRKTADDALTYMEKLFKDNRVTSVVVESYGTFTDQYGNDHDEMVMNVSMDKATANKMGDWNYVRTSLYSDNPSLNVFNSYSINPSIYKGLTFYVPISK